MFRHGNGHNADRSSASDQNIFTEQVERQRRMDRVAKWIEDAGDIARDVCIVNPDVGHRQRQVIGKRPGPIHADTLRVLAQMTPPGETVPATATDNVPFAADDVTNMKVMDIVADLDDPADELVADGHWHGNRLLGPRVPLVDMDIGAADAGLEDLDLAIVDPNRGLGNLFEPQTWFGMFFDEGTHMNSRKK
jgi:hypothetical protein